MQKLKRFGLYLILLLFLLIVMLYSLQEKLIFLPTQLPNNYEYSFAHDFEEIFLNTSDGAKLNAIHFKTERPKGLILYFHGNAGDLSRWGQITSSFVELGYDVLVMDYRGYGKSTGKLSEEALYTDAHLFYSHALKTYTEENIIIYGRSLGASIATHLASNTNPAKLILETPFYSLLDVAQDRFPFFPIKHVLKYEMSSYKYIKTVNAPIRIFHGTVDNVVAYESGLKLFEAIPNSDKKMYTIENGNHNDLNDFEVYRKGIELELD
ncbi:alpha/beta hydrolase [Flagellimonas eckloniae]|uniref:Hydrolase n=1 Tax=Flagellimonas eckloniae TaxID=346185 RepID=A0A0Q1DJZ6_9FLAO|nr:alpha/beta fold hydrolase [Allomuricauda eckloniae]KQC29145.1 hydrolase [Allomuricauda eckloniae]